MMSHSLYILFSLFLTNALDVNLVYQVGDYIDVKCSLTQEGQKQALRLEDRFKVAGVSEEGIFFLEKMPNIIKDKTDSRTQFRLMQTDDGLVLAWKQKPKSGTIWDIRALLKYEAPKDYASEGDNTSFTVSNYAGAIADPFISTKEYSGSCSFGVY